MCAIWKYGQKEMDCVDLQRLKSKSEEKTAGARQGGVSEGGAVMEGQVA